MFFNRYDDNSIKEFNKRNDKNLLIERDENGLTKMNVVRLTDKDKERFNISNVYVNEETSLFLNTEKDRLVIVDMYSCSEEDEDIKFYLEHNFFKEIALGKMIKTYSNNIPQITFNNISAIAILALILISSEVLITLFI